MLPLGAAAVGLQLPQAAAGDEILGIAGKVRLPVFAVERMADLGVIVHVAEQRGQRGGHILAADVGDQVVHQPLQAGQLAGFHLLHQGINVGIMEIKGAAADPGKLGQLPHGDLP